MDDIEIFKIIKDFPKYEVSNFGRVRNIRTGTMRVPNDRWIFNTHKTRKRKKAQSLVLQKGGKDYGVRIHQVVMAAFGAESPGKIYTIDHIDRNPFNNHISNLRWATPKQQTDNRGAYTYSPTNRKQKATRSRLTNTLKKLSEKEINAIYELTQTETMDNIAKMVGITAFNLHIILKYVHPLY